MDLVSFDLQTKGIIKSLGYTWHLSSVFLDPILQIGFYVIALVYIHSLHESSCFASPVAMLI